VKLWKKIEHWLVVVIIMITMIGGPLCFIFSEELGLQRQASDDAPAPYPDAYGRP
jgi:hypothetical protein